MADLELTIVVQDKQTVRARTDSGREAAGEMKLTSWRIDLIRVFQRWLAQDKISERRELEVLGSLLYDLLFGHEISLLYEDLRSKVQPDEKLRIQLSFYEKAAGIANYPWEFLYVPDTEVRRGYFMATSADLVLSRYIPLNIDRGSLDPGELPLRLLIVVSEPDDPGLGRVVSGPVIEAIEEFAQELPIEIHRQNRPTVDRFLDTLEEVKPHILHFIGHGQYNTVERQGEIALLDDDNRSVWWVSDRDFADYFKYMKALPRLVILHSCEGGANDMTAKFAGLAPQLIRSGVQAVVAMQYMITNQAAIDFSRYFYRYITRGEPVDYAVQTSRGRMQISNAKYFDSRVFGTPMLYMRARDGIMLPEGQ